MHVKVLMPWYAGTRTICAHCPCDLPMSQVRFPAGVEAAGLDSIAAGHYHSLCIDRCVWHDLRQGICIAFTLYWVSLNYGACGRSGGGLWSWGRNIEGQLGRRTAAEPDTALLPGLVPGLAGIRVLHTNLATWLHSVFVNNKRMRSMCGSHCKYRIQNTPRSPYWL